MKTTGNTTKGIKTAALILIMIVLSVAFSVGQANPAAVNTAAYGFNLSGESANAVSLTTDQGFTETDLEESIELEPWMSEFGNPAKPAAEETENEPEPMLENWMTDLSTWQIQ